LYITYVLVVFFAVTVCECQSYLLYAPTQFDSSIIHLQNTPQQISSWIIANFLTLNSSKIEFPLFGLKNNLHVNSSLNISHTARNLGFIFNEHLTFSDLITSLSKDCYYHVRQLRCIRSYLDSSIFCPAATYIVHSKVD